MRSMRKTVNEIITKKSKRFIIRTLEWVKKNWFLEWKEKCNKRSAGEEGKTRDPIQEARLLDRHSWVCRKMYRKDWVIDRCNTVIVDHAVRFSCRLTCWWSSWFLVQVLTKGWQRSVDNSRDIWIVSWIGNCKLNACLSFEWSQVWRREKRGNENTRARKLLPTKEVVINAWCCHSISSSIQVLFLQKKNVSRAERQLSPLTPPSQTCHNLLFSNQSIDSNSCFTHFCHDYLSRQ